MVFDYAKIQGIAGKVLGQFEQGVVSLLQLTDGAGPAYNPGNPTVVTTVLQATVQGVKSSFNNRDFDVRAGDMVVTAAVVAGITPKVGDMVSIDGDRLHVIKYEPIPPAGTTVVWKLTVRRE